MAALSEKFGLAELTYNGSLILTNGSEKGLIDVYNNFLGLNIGNSPMDTMKKQLCGGELPAPCGCGCDSCARCGHTVD